MKSIKNIVLIGTGNVSWHVGHALISAGKKITQVVGRKTDITADYARALNATAITTTNNIDQNADLFLICVNDGNIGKVQQQLIGVNGIVAHTSGSIPMGKTNKKNGVFYPLQTFSKQLPVDFTNLPILVEGSTDETTLVLEELAKTISNAVFRITSEQREILHVAAVFANNFSNHMFAQAYNICQQNNVPFETLHALITETSKKALKENPNLIQTGPAIRKDTETIEKHMKFLQNSPAKELYELITKSIINTNETKL